MPKKIFVLCGHPDAESMAGYLAGAYEKGARDAGHEVRRLNVGELRFDPILHKGYKVIQELEPDLRTIQENMRWAEHIVIAYPNWWGAMPALLKGMFDRMLLPGFGFKFRKNSVWWDKLLSGRSARVIVTMDNHPLLASLLFGDTGNEIRRATLGFCGIAPIRLSRVGRVRFMSDGQKARVWQKMHAIGMAGK